MKEKIKLLEDEKLIFKDNNFEIYLVGGAVRDLLQDKTGKDWDLTTSATPEEILKLFPDGFYDNLFGTVGIPLKKPEETDSCSSNCSLNGFLIIDHIRKYHRWPQKHIVFTNHARINGHIVLNLYIIAQHYFRHHYHVLPQAAMRSNNTTWHHMAKMPYACSASDRTSGINNSRIVCRVIHVLLQYTSLTFRQSFATSVTFFTAND